MRNKSIRAKKIARCRIHRIAVIFIAFCFFQFYLFAEKINFTADSMTGSAKNDNTTTVLNGEAYIVTESIEIEANRIELSGDDYRTIKANGNVKGKNFDSNMEFTCSTLEYDRKTKIALLRGDVKLIDTENSVNAQAQMIEYNSDTDIAVLQIGINLTQKDNICTASYAVYHKKEQMLNLSGNAKIKQKEDTFRAQHITLNMDTEEITLDGRVKGTVTEKNDSKEKEESSDNSENEQEGENAADEMKDGDSSGEENAGEIEKSVDETGNQANETETTTDKELADEAGAKKKDESMAKE